METLLNSVLEQSEISTIDSFKNITEYQLKTNGLKILLSENHAAPVATLMVLYRVGSRNEGAGFTGATHFLEHMMFKGTQEYSPDDGRGIDDILKPLGAVYNATTWFDRTNYFECFPSIHLEQCVALEADRMRNLQLRSSDRDLEMTVVRNEFERGENEPDDVLSKELWAIAFREHPYHWPTIGWRSEVESVPMSKLKDFYDTFYWPNNALVLVAGDFQPAQALEYIVKHFGKHTQSPAPIPQVYTTEPPQQGERRFQISRAGDLPRVAIGYHTPQATSADTYALAAMAAVLGGSRRSSRLYKRLIDTNLAASVGAHQFELHDPGLFQISATISPGVKPEVVEEALLEEIAKLANQPVTNEELIRAQKANRKATVLQSADPLSWAQMIAEAESVADWRWMLSYDDKFDKVTPQDITRVAQKYFCADNRTTGYFIPKVDVGGSNGVEGEVPATGEATPALHIDSSLSADYASTPSASTDAASDAAVPTGAKASALHAKAGTSEELEILSGGGHATSTRSGGRTSSQAKKPAFANNVQKVVLPNGLTLLVMQNTGADLTAISGKIKAGSYFAPINERIVASLVSQMLTKGSSAYEKIQLGEILEEMGTSLGFAGDNFTVNFGTNVVNEDLPQMLDIITNVLQEPLFLEEEFEKTKKEFNSYFQLQMTDTGVMSKIRLSQALYKPGSPYYAIPFEELIQQLDRANITDLKSFHSKYYSPQSTICSIVSSLEPDKIIELIKSKFNNWAGNSPSPVLIEEFKIPEKSQRIEVFMPEKANVDIHIGLPCSLKRTDADFLAARIANSALGQDTLSSRLGLEVRERNGLTYGIYSRFEDTSFGGAPWTIDLSTNPAYVEKALKLVEQVVRNYIASGITPEELTAEAGRAAGNFQLALRTSGGIASAITSHEFLGLGFAAMDSYATDIASVTKKQVDAAISKYFQFDHTVTAIAGTLINAKINA